MTFQHRITILALMLGLNGCADPAGPAPEPQPNRSSPYPSLVLPSPRLASNNGPGGGYIAYNSEHGPVLGATKVVAVYWSPTTLYNGGPTPGTTGLGAADGSFIGLFLRSFGNSPWWGITNQYTDNSATRPGPFIYSNYWADSDVISTPGDFDIDQVEVELINGINAGKLPQADGHTIYVFFMGAGIVPHSPGGFLQIGELYYGQGQCGFHYSTLSAIPYVVLGYPQTGSGCEKAGLILSPISDQIAAAQVAYLAHELAETVTNPFPPVANAYSDGSKNFGDREVDDHCSFVFNGPYYPPGGGVATMRVGGVDFYVQSLLVNVPLATCVNAADTALSTSAATATKGWSSSISAVCTPAYGAWACPVSWSTSDSTIATVSATNIPNQGSVLGTGVGTATLTGCSYSVCGSSQVTIHAPLPITINGQTSVRPGATCLWWTTVSTGTPPYTYQWTGNQITGTLQPDGSFSGQASNTPGPASVTVYMIDAQGIQGSKTLNVTISSSARVCPRIRTH